MGSTILQESINDDQTSLVTKDSIVASKNKFVNTEAEQIITANADDHRNFSLQLLKTVANLYERPLFSDINIKFGQSFFSCHKFVLVARSNKWEQEIVNTDELDWSYLEEDVGHALLKWLYTDIISAQTLKTILGLIQAANHFNLSELFNNCENLLISSVDVQSCVEYYCVSEKVKASKLRDCCFTVIQSHWDYFKTTDFDDVSATLLHSLLKNITNFPLHAAIKLHREDVVRLWLTDNEKDLSMVNISCQEGYLPLQLALNEKHLKIAEALVEIGSANVDAYNKNGFPLFIDFISKGDVFAANFLLQKNCDVNLIERCHGNTGLHYVCSFNPTSCDEKTCCEWYELGEKLLIKLPNLNLQNEFGETPFYKAIAAQNAYMINSLLDDINLIIDVKSEDVDCALELLFSVSSSKVLDYKRIAKKLIEKGAKVDILKSESQNTLLQELILKKLEDPALYLIDYCSIDTLNNINKLGHTALHMASELNLPHLINKLLKVGASPDVHSEISKLNNPIHIGVATNSEEALYEFAHFSYLACDVKYNLFNDKNAEDASPLVLSLILKKEHLIPILIEGGADINMKDTKNGTLLHQAIINGNTNAALLLLDYADLTILTNQNESALLLAIRHRCTEVVHALCAKGVGLNVTTSTGDCPLWSAVKFGYEDICKILIQNGADTDNWINDSDGLHQNLLHKAIVEQNETAAILLIRYGCDLDSPRQFYLNGNKKKLPPLHLCALNGLINTLQTLIDYGANVNTADDEENTVLHVAIENKQEDIISIVLCHPDVELKMRNNKGSTPFALALRMKNHNAAQRILERHPNAAEQMDKRGRNFLHTAIMEDDLETMLFLLSIQIDVNTRVHDVNQSTPLHIAAARSNELIIRNLLLAGARINEHDSNYKTPLLVASESGNYSAISVFIQNNADIDSTDSEGNNALHISVRFGHLGIVRELLVESNIKADTLNEKGRTPLHELCQFCDDNIGVSIFELFLECMPKYPLNTQDNEGNTPLLLAYMRGKASLCKSLVKSGACLGTENSNRVSIFSFKLATNQLLHKLLSQLSQESPWSECESCQECTTKFTLTLRKHHCRHCGRVLCSKCSSHDIPILKFGLNKPVRVCYICFNVLQGNNIV